MDTLISMISNLGHTARLPRSRVFVSVIAVSVIGFIISYTLWFQVTDGISKEYDEVGPSKYVLVPFMAFMVLAFLYSATAMVFRTVFHTNGLRIVRNVRQQGIPTARLEAISQSEFSDGCTVLAWLAYLVGIYMLWVG
ncbi:hypothetical protein FBZ90_108134 [Nitrospirillum pindoramense]|uniref:Uncharacterized protein n=2 Tax=Nitrospirillum amazonense TaxID=28077 RepID=A0A560H6B5_9PROT|nr:hypothetical protein FBZ90_108134 [Nitrospirillum amazonense]